MTFQPRTVRLVQIWHDELANERPAGTLMSGSRVFIFVILTESSNNAFIVTNRLRRTTCWNLLEVHEDDLSERQK